MAGTGESQKRNMSVALAVASALLAPASGALAQGDEDTVEEIIVTGSRIKRRDFTSPSPISTIDKDTLAFSGQPTLEGVINQMPQVMPDFGRTSNNPGNGTARVNLRGVGSGRTLVLLNGRRVAPSGVGSAIDVNNIPQALIERVEIVTGGASTVYGSDAIAGVINFISKDDFSGFSIEASYGVTEENDGQAYDLNLAYGHNLASGRGNITVYGGFHERKDLFMGSRDLTSVTLFNDDDTGTLFEAGSGLIPDGVIYVPDVDLGGNTQAVTFDADGTPRQYDDPGDRFNYAPDNYLQTPLTRYTAGIMANYELDSGYEIYLESSFARNEAASELAPVPAFDFAAVNTDNPVLTPETRQLFIDNYEVQPGLSVIGVGRRLVEVGPRIIEAERDYWRTVIGVRGEIGRGWDIDGWFTYTTASEDEFYLNDGSASRFVQGLLVDPATGACFDPSNGCVPLDIFGPGRISEEGANFLRITDVQNDTTREQILAAVVATGAPLETWAGPLDMAFGLEWRSDDASFAADPVLFTGDTLGFSGRAPIEGKESVFEVYGEAVIPLAQGITFADYLDVEIGARYSEYDLAGGVWTYKAGSNWQPIEGLRFRGMFQHSVRAPNNAELFEELYTESWVFVVDPSDDPCSASNNPVAAGFTEKCVMQGMPASEVGVFEATTVPTDFIAGGNPSLVPEDAKTWTIGAVIMPTFMPNWQFSVDYYDMEVTDSIGSINASDICFDPANTENLYCDNLTRTTAAGYNVIEVFEPTSNRGLIATRGVDTQVNWQTDLPGALSLFADYSQLGVDLVWTHMLEHNRQLNPVAQALDCAGLFGDFCADDSFVGATLPENRVTTNFSYIAGNLNIHLTHRWIEGTDSARIKEAELFGTPPPNLAIPSVGSEHYLDLGFGYTFNDSITVRLNINNLTDTDLPNMADSIVNSDLLLYDPFGRSYYLSVSANFLN